MSRFSPDASGANRFQVPDVTLTAKNMAINGGYAFDVPLAGLTVMQNNAMAFVGANNQLSQKSVLSQYVLGGDSVDLTFSRAGASVTAPSVAALDSVSRGLASTLSFMSTAHADAMATQRYTAKRGSKSCFITTAICRAEGKPDHCVELYVLRTWRDNWLRKYALGEALIGIYYEIAPQVVKQVDSLPVAPEFYANLRALYLMPAIDAILIGDNERALSLYVQMIESALKFVNQHKAFKNEQPDN